MVSILLAMAFQQSPPNEFANPKGHFGEVFSGRYPATVRAVFPGRESDPSVGRFHYRFSGPDRKLGSSLILMHLLRSTRTDLSSRCLFRPDHLISVKVGEDVAEILTCFSCAQVITSFRGKQAYGRMADSDQIRTIMDQAVPREDHRTGHLVEAVGEAVAAAISSDVKATYTIDEGKAQALDQVRRKWLRVILSTHFVPGAVASRATSRVTLRFEDESKTTLAFDFKNRTLNSSPMSIDWDLLQQCLLSPER